MNAEVVIRALVTGAGGQVGRQLLVSAPEGAAVLGLASADLDITDRAAVMSAVADFRPDLIFNAAAYTGVDRAESDSERAFAVNRDAVGHLADAAAANNARLVHISTDFVFDGSAGTPYRPDSPVAPLGVYGQSKLEGERLAANDSITVRTAWVYDAQGANFVRTMLRLMQERDKLGVVADQIGTPTWAGGLAQALWLLAKKAVTGVYHYTDSGAASWYDFALAIREDAAGIGLIDDTAALVLPITTADYPTPARRPAYSVLDKSSTWEVLGEPAPHWRVQLRRVLRQIHEAGRIA